MDAGTQLRRTVAEFFQVDEARVGPAFSLAGRPGSVARAALDAAIRRRVGVKSRAVYSAKTFGELAAELGLGSDGAATAPMAAPAAVPSAVPTPAAATAPAGAAACGVDIELIADLPAAPDPWEDPFYRTHFSPSEIAYCLRQAEPAAHFAGRWCAKEALKKCDRAFLVADGKDIEVVNDEAGAPHLVHHAADGPRRLPHAVSLSHTAHAAVAVVVRVDAPPPAPAATPTAPAPIVAGPEAHAEARPGGRRASALLVALNLITLAAAAFALYRTTPGLRWPFPG